MFDRFGVLLICSCLAIAALPSRAAPVAIFEDIAIATRDVPRLAQVRQAIVAAGEALEWKFQDAGAGRLVGSLTVRNRHMVEVEVKFSPQRYSVIYRNSVNMNYDEADRSIHANYNVWVRDLVEAINTEVAALDGPAQAPVAAARPSVPAVPAAASTAPSAPSSTDTWTYRLSYPKRWGEPERSVRTMVVKLGTQNESGVVDQVSLDGGAAVDMVHPKGAYLATQGVSIFSPYLDTVRAAGGLGNIEILDPPCKGAYVCTAKARYAGTETLKVAAGTFKATRIIVEQSWRSAGSGSQQIAAQMNGGRVLTIWYAPDVKRAVKYTSRLTVGDVPAVDANFDLELTSYQLK